MQSAPESSRTIAPQRTAARCHQKLRQPSLIQWPRRRRAISVDGRL